VIQRHILKVVAKIRELGLSRAFVNFGRESILTDNKPFKKPELPGWVLFARETVRNPRVMGTCWSSSPNLANAIAAFVPDQEGIVIELGSGTGIVTDALLKYGIAAERLISIEQSPELTKHVRKRCPNVRVINGDALDLEELLGDDFKRVTTIVSSLPFRSLPHAVRHGIIKQIDQALPKNGLLIQFTYDLTGRSMSLPSHLKRVSHKIIWGNFPPARIDVYRQQR
jgi:phospholipid N-methyltransferase